MYQVVYYYKETVGKSVEEKVIEGAEFRLKRNALHYIFDVVQSDFREDNYGTEPIVGGINCYKSEKTNEEERKIMEVRVKVEKA